MSDALKEIERTTRIFFVCVCGAVVLAAIALAAALTMRELSRQSVECVKAGGEWHEHECRKGKR